MEIREDRSMLSSREIEEAVSSCLVSRRNYYLGLWAGRRLGVPETELRSYALSVVEADFATPGHEDVVRKLSHDFAASGEDVSREEILQQLQRSSAVAARQFIETD